MIAIHPMKRHDEHNYLRKGIYSREDGSIKSVDRFG